MKDKIYNNLLKEVRTRVFAAMGDSEDASRALAQLESEMKRVKEILISSGHDLKDVKEFSSSIQSEVYMSLVR